MIFLAYATAAFLATSPPKIVKAFADEKSCLAAAEELNSYPQTTSVEAIKNGSGFVCLKIVDVSV